MSRVLYFEPRQDVFAFAGKVLSRSSIRVAIGIAMPQAATSIESLMNT
jgi:hypothetical protein